MPRAHPSLLRKLVERRETLRRRLASGGNAETRRQLQDASYTLCVVTGTRHVETALSVARRQLADAMRRELMEVTTRSRTSALLLRGPHGWPVSTPASRDAVGFSWIMRRGCRLPSATRQGSRSHHRTVSPDRCADAMSFSVHSSLSADTAPWAWTSTPHEPRWSRPSRCPCGRGSCPHHPSPPGPGHRDHLEPAVHARQFLRGDAEFLGDPGPGFLA
ncbi:DUF5133 domain-containing protein [Streptomyces sp. NPDC002867]